MLTLFLIIISIAAPGLALITFIYPRFISGLRAFGLIYGIGAAVVTLELFLYFVIFRQTFSAGLYWFFGLQTLAALIVFAWRFPWKKRLSFEARRIKPLSWLLIVIVAVLLFLSLVQALGKPPLAFDTIAFWGMRAKILLKVGVVNFDPASAPYLSAFSHSNYPWHLSLLEFWFRTVGAIGGVVNLIAWFYFASLIMLLADFSIKRLGQIKGLLLTVFFCSQPFIFYHASNNYADLIVAYYAAAGFAFLLEWLESGRLNRLILATFFFAFTFNIKNYGIFYIIALLVALVAAYLLKVRRLNLRSYGWTMGALLIPLVPIALFKILNKLNLRNTEAAWVWKPEVMEAFGQSLFISNNWNIWWAIFIVTGLMLSFVIWRHKELLSAWLSFLVLPAILIVIFTVTENYQWALDHTALSRAFIPLIPISILLFAFSLQKRYVHGNLFSRR